ncbi:MAG: hypothetical protein H7Y89_16140 [Steroidobacteraceae bacterium]|nr:hypothetical protein [Steroidobacteraceae bacterium]
MARIAVSITLAFLGTLAAVLLHERNQMPAPVPVAGQQEMFDRLDRLERAIIQIGARAQPEPATGPAVEILTPPLPTPQDDARQSAIRTSNEIVDRAMGAARWTIEDASDLAAATVSLDGMSRAELFARVSAAINADQLQVDATALRF